jgi:hypothetical protein
MWTIRLMMLLWLLQPALVWAADSSGRFVQPRMGTPVSGNLVVSVQAQDLDGLARVYVSFNNSPQMLVLCQSAAQCQGSRFNTTLTNIDPMVYGVNPGALNLQLWVTDGSGSSTSVANVNVDWQPPTLNVLNVVRSIAGSQINVSWSANPAVLRYNLYLASVSGVNRMTYRQLPDGQARLAVRSTAEVFSGLDPNKQYYLLVAGINGSGESALAAQITIPPTNAAPNTPPVAVDDNYKATINQPLVVDAGQGLLVNDTDPDGDTLRVELTPVSLPVSGTLLLSSDGSFSYTPNLNFTGNDSFVYQVSDGKGATALATAFIEVNQVITNITGSSLSMTGEFLYIGKGETLPGSAIGTGLYRIGDCIQLVDTRCSMQGRYVEDVASGNKPGQQGNFTFIMTYPGVADSPVLARSVAPNSNSLQFVGSNPALFELSLFPDSGGKFSGLYPATPFIDSLNFGAFIAPGAVCSGLNAAMSCSIGQVGQVDGARIMATLNNLTFTIPGSALNNNGPFLATASDDLYPAVVNSPLNIAAPGVLANDSEGKGLLQGNQLEIRHSLIPGLGSLVGLAANEYKQALYLYPAFGSAIQLMNRLGVNLGAVTMQGEGANDVDLDIAQQAFTLKDAQIPQGSLLIFNGETDVTEIYAVDANSGTLLSKLDTAFGASHVVGGAYNPVTNTIWLIQDNVPAGALGNRVAQIDPVTGQVLSSFSTITAQHSFGVSYGDLHINPHNGHILLVSSIQSSIAEFDVDGNLVRLLALPQGVTTISGLAVSADGKTLWLASTSGVVFELGFANLGAVPTLSASLLSGPTNGTLLLQRDGSFRYTPNAAFIGNDSFTYQVSGAFGGVSTATVVISVQ